MTNLAMEGKTTQNSSAYRQLYQDLIDHILKGKGESSEAERRAAFDNSGLTEPGKTLIDKVARSSYRVTDGDLEALIKLGKSEDEIFELVICGAVGQASRQYQSGLSALAEAIKSEKGGADAS